MGNTGATEAPQNSEQSLWVPTSHAASRQQLLSSLHSLSCHPSLYFFFLNFLYRSVALSGIFFFSLCHSLPLSASLFFRLPSCHSIAPPLLAPPHNQSRSPPEDAVSAALVDLDVMKLQVCQHGVCVFDCVWESRSEKVRSNIPPINNSPVKMASRKVNSEMDACASVCVCMSATMDQLQCLSCPRS